MAVAYHDLAAVVVDQVVIDGEERKFEPIGHTDLIKDVSKMVLYRLFADGKPFGDFAVGQTGNDGTDDFEFAWRESKPFS